MPLRMPRTIADVISLWASPAECAKALGKRYKEHQPRDWAKRGSVPSEHIAPLVSAAQSAGHAHITAEVVVAIIAREAAAKKRQAA